MIFQKISHISAALAATMALAWGTQAYSDIYAVHEVTDMKMQYDLQKSGGVVKDKKVTAEDLLNALSAKDPAGGNEILAAFTNCENPDVVHIGVWNTNKEKIPNDSTSITLTRGIFVEEESDDGKSSVQTANFTTEQLDGVGFGDSIDMLVNVEYSKLPKDLKPEGSGGMNKICVSKFKVEGSVGSTREGSGVVTETKLKFLEPFFTQTSEPPVTPVPPIEEVAAIALIKHIVGGDPYSAAGDEIDYEYEVANIGDLDILSLAVVDDKTDVDCGAFSTLVPGDRVTCSASYTVTDKDVTAGSVVNKAVAVGVSANTVETAKSDAKATLDTSPSPPEPELAMQKVVTGGNPFSGVDEKISYAYLVVNKGNEKIDGITVSDSLATFDDCFAEFSLATGDTMVCTASYFTTDLDVKRGWVVNKATAKGTSNPSNIPVETSTTATAKRAP